MEICSTITLSAELWHGDTLETHSAHSMFHVKLNPDICIDIYIQGFVQSNLSNKNICHKKETLTYHIRPSNKNENKKTKQFWSPRLSKGAAIYHGYLKYLSAMI